MNTMVLITLCWNEESIARWVIDYWLRLRSQLDDLKVVIWDNCSDDDSVKIFSQYDWIEIRQFKSDGMNDVIHQYIKNNCWKEFKGKYRWCCICDIDELLWSNYLVEELQYMKDNGYNVLGNEWIAFCGDKEPEYEEGKYLHQLVKRGYHQYINHMPQYKHLGKFILFDMEVVEEINYSVGMHILFSMKPNFKLYQTNKIITFHINKGLSEDFFVNRRKIMGERLSDTNKKYKMAIEYLNPEDEIRKEYRNYQKESFDISEL